MDGEKFATKPNWKQIRITQSGSEATISIDNEPLPTTFYIGGSNYSGGIGEDGNWEMFVQTPEQMKELLEKGETELRDSFSDKTRRVGIRKYE